MKMMFNEKRLGQALKREARMLNRLRARASRAVDLYNKTAQNVALKGVAAQYVKAGAARISITSIGADSTVPTAPTTRTARRSGSSKRSASPRKYTVTPKVLAARRARKAKTAAAKKTAK